MLLCGGMIKLTGSTEYLFAGREIHGEYYIWYNICTKGAEWLLEVHDDNFFYGTTLFETKEDVLAFAEKLVMEPGTLSKEIDRFTIYANFKV